MFVVPRALVIVVSFVTLLWCGRWDRSLLAQSTAGSPGEDDAQRMRELSGPELQVLVTAVKYIRKREGRVESRFDVNSIPLGATSLAMQRISWKSSQQAEAEDRRVLRGLLKHADGKRLSIDVKDQQKLTDQRIYIQSRGGAVEKRENKAIVVSVSTPFVMEAEQAAIVVQGNIGECSCELFYLKWNRVAKDWDVSETEPLLIE